MKKSSLIITILIFTLSFLLVADASVAGSRHHERWKGVAIGMGAAILGSVLLHNYEERAYQRNDDCHVSVERHRHFRHKKRRGHWEVRKEWVPPTYKKVWNPGHYNRHGEWIEGHWMKIVIKQGSWIKKRVWVASNSKRHSERRRY